MDRPNLVAKFLLDNGRPEYKEINGRKHYRIRLQVLNAPTDTHAVTYELDDSYYDPLRVVRKKPTFEEEITSFGDYDIQARIRKEKRSDVIAERLSDALRRGHDDNLSPAIARAIKDIEDH